MGSLAVIKKGKNENSPSISITAHMDEVGFMVTQITSKGFIKFSPIGGWWGHTVLAKRLTITTDSGKQIVGVVGSKPPHLLKYAETKQVLPLDQMFIDIGATSNEEVKERGIMLGNMITPTQENVVEMMNERILGKAHDDRIAVAIGIEVIRRLSKIDHDSSFTFIASTQEEVGLRRSKNFFL